MLSTIFVNSLDDNTFEDGQITLREAIIAANDDKLADAIEGMQAGNGADTIEFDPNVFNAAHAMLLEMGEFEITEALTIAGPGQDLLTIDAQQNSRIFNIVAATGNYTVTGLTLTGGNTSGDNDNIFDTTFSGGAIRSLTNGDLKIDLTTITENSTQGFFASGGGVFAIGDLTLIDSVVTGNHTMGLVGFGGGLYTRLDATLIDSTIAGNNTLTGGGGLFALGAAILTGTSVTANGSTNGVGGGVQATTINLTSASVSGNSAGNSGGGLFASGNVVLTGSTVSGNRSASNGGGLFTFNDVALTDSSVQDNSTTRSGGGVFAYGSVTLTGSTVSSNSSGELDVDMNAIGYGGGIYVGQNVMLTNSTISGNRAANSGGGVYAKGPVTVVSSTIAVNHSLTLNSMGGGIWNDDDPVIISNSIVAGNMAGFFRNPDLEPGTGELSVAYSLIGNTSGLTIAGPGNILNQDPLLAPLGNNTGLTETHALLANSPAIDAGDPGFAFPLAHDQRGGPFARIADGDGMDNARVDMGAYERQTILNAPFPLIVSTLDDESDGDYTAGDLSLREAVGLANGSVGAEVIGFDAAVFATPQTSPLSLGEIVITEGLTIAGPGQNLLTIDAQQNSRIFNIAATTGDFTITGLTLTGGKTNGDNSNFLDTTYSGGAIRSLATGNLTFDHTTIAGNETQGYFAAGGGVFALGDVTFKNSVVSGNNTAGRFAFGGGGAVRGNVMLIDSTASENSTLGERANGGGLAATGAIATNSTISNNSTEGHAAVGGGLYTGEAADLMDSTISGNSTTGVGADGGGLYARGLATLASSTFTGNSTHGNGARGGGMSSKSGNLTVTDSEFAHNSTAGQKAYGGGLDISSGDATVTNSRFLENTTTGFQGFGAGLSVHTGTLKVVGSTISGNITTGRDGIGAGINSKFGYLTVDSSTISNNMALNHGADAGGIYGGVELIVTDSIITGNRSSDDGGGIFGKGNVTVINTFISDNHTFDEDTFGGGVTAGNTVTVIGSTISNNSSVGFFYLGSRFGGGGIQGKHVVVESSTVSNNTSGGDGAGIMARNTLKISNSTIWGNSTELEGGGVRTGTESSFIENSIIAGNFDAVQSNDLKYVGSQPLVIRYSLIGNNVGTLLEEAQSADANGNLIGSSTGAGIIDPMLGALADNGGPTLTHALLPGSPAIDAGDPLALPGEGSIPLYDQRGIPFGRVEDGTGSGPPAVIDIGAFELSAQSADFDADLDVDGVDFLIWQRGFGTIAPTANRVDGDADGDRDTDGDDLAVWENQFGQGAGVTTATSTSHQSPPARASAVPASPDVESIARADLIDRVMAMEMLSTSIGGDQVVMIEDMLSPESFLDTMLVPSDPAPPHVMETHNLSLPDLVTFRTWKATNSVDANEYSLGWSRRRATDEAIERLDFYSLKKTFRRPESKPVAQDL